MNAIKARELTNWNMLDKGIRSLIEVNANNGKNSVKIQLSNDDKVILLSLGYSLTKDSLGNDIISW